MEGSCQSQGEEEMDIILIARITRHTCYSSVSVLSPARISHVLEPIQTTGWVSGEGQLERCRAVIQSIRDSLIGHSSTEIENTAVLYHFPFDDHEEIRDVF